MGLSIFENRGKRKALKRIEQARKSESKTLDLSDLGLTTIPESIGSLTQLQQLLLNSNQIKEIPESIGSLTQLQQLFLRNNQIKEIPESIGSLIRLKFLYLNNNQIKEIPESIGSLTELRQLFLPNNQIKKIPESIGSLIRLKFLYLNNNQIKEIPESIGSLTELRQLFLRNNQIKEIPESIGSLTHLEELSLNDNPLNPELAAVYEQGFDELRRYLLAKKGQKITLNEAKLILIGEGEVGKSCLLGALRGDPWIKDRLTTHGLEIKPFQITDPDTNTQIILNGWDFGGQREYRTTHQLFFTAPAIYLVIWKPREGSQQGFVKWWITLILHREPDAKIIVVATHGGPGRRHAKIDRNDLLEKFGQETILDFIQVDSKPDAQGNCLNIPELKLAIAKAAMKLPEMGRTIPASWQKVREKLRSRPEPYLTYDQAVTICQTEKMDLPQAELFLKISHELGNLIHYDNDGVIKDIVILKPDWLAKAISFVLDSSDICRDKGLVSCEKLSELWRDPPYEDESGYDSSLHPIFLKLMERYELSYKVNSANDREEKKVLIAQLVPDSYEGTLPDWSDTLSQGESQQVQICRIVDFDGQLAEAEGLFYRLIVRHHRYSLGVENYEQSVHWQQGLMLDNGIKGRALLEKSKQGIKITVRAVYPELFLSHLTEDIIWMIKDFWPGLICNVMVSCIEPCGKNKPGTGLFEVQRLIGSKRKNRSEYPCPFPGCEEWQDIDLLLANAPIAQPQDKSDGALERIESALQTANKNIVKSDRNNRQRYENLSVNQQKALVQAEEQYKLLMQTLTDEAKDGPRLFSFKPLEPGFFDRPKWVSTKIQVTLWCEHSRKPLPQLNPDNPKLGVYELTISQEWLAKSAPVLKNILRVLSLVAPVAVSSTDLILGDSDYAGIEEELNLAQKTLVSASKGGDDLLDWQTKTDAPNLDYGDGIEARGIVLRELHAMLKKKDLKFGGLVRVQNQRKEFLWVHPKFENEYL